MVLIQCNFQNSDGTVIRIRIYHLLHTKRRSNLSSVNKSRVSTLSFFFGKVLTAWCWWRLCAQLPAAAQERPGPGGPAASSTASCTPQTWPRPPPGKDINSAFYRFILSWLMLRQQWRVILTSFSKLYSSSYVSFFMTASMIACCGKEIQSINFVTYTDKNIFDGTCLCWNLTSIFAFCWSVSWES